MQLESWCVLSMVRATKNYIENIILLKKNRQDDYASMREALTRHYTKKACRKG